ncbi:hypothetical protein CNEO2_440029 [Clostridium neonatale]|nr:hypothetical protein CNEO2_520030 [Clostridium neonatale]CAI3210672.1 hypothetical protein CNEO2_440029 [Clostridium neonatale]
MLVPIVIDSCIDAIFIAAAGYIIQINDEGRKTTL